VDTHRANILKKLGITSNAELYQIAHRCGLVG
jgi:DNA-binding CsgD family transcriptional regulator